MLKKLVIATLITVFTFSTAMAQNAVPAEAPVSGEQGYATNVARIAPITAMDVGFGFGLSYEKIFGKAQMVGLVLPVTLLLEKKNSFDLGTPYSNSKYNTYVYFTPGIKIYPFGQRKVTYAVGPNLMLGYGGGNEWQYQMDLDGSEHLYNVKTTRWRLGFLMNNYVNIQISKSVNLGLEGGLGVRYLDRVSYTGGSDYYAGNGEFNYGFDIAGQFSFTLGYRF